MEGLLAQAQNGKPAPPGFEQLREMPGPFGRIQGHGWVLGAWRRP